MLFYSASNRTKRIKKLKREEVLARAKASQKQSDEVFKNLEGYLQVCSCNQNEN